MFPTPFPRTSTPVGQVDFLVHRCAAILTTPFIARREDIAVAEQTIRHLTDGELEAAIEAKTARVVFSRPGWRLVIHDGLKYSCVATSVSLWTQPAGNRNSDYRGRKTVWMIKKVELDTGHERKQPRRTMEIEALIPRLKQAIAHAENGRWKSLNWPLLKPENIQALIDEIERARPMEKAA